MSDVSPTVLFEHPLNEKMRTWLRIEFLLQQLHGQRALSETAIALTFFRTISDLLDVLERGEVRTELLKELERQQQKLLAWADVPGVDMALIDQLRGQLKSRSSALMAAPRLGQALREDRLIGLVRQRLNIPGGCCSFDLPTLHMWMHAPPASLAIPLPFSCLKHSVGRRAALFQRCQIAIPIERRPGIGFAAGGDIAMPGDMRRQRRIMFGQQRGDRLQRAILRLGVG